MNSIVLRKDAFLCPPGEEQYDSFRSPNGGKWKVQYRYRTEDCTLFTTIADDLTQAKRERDWWLEERERHRCTKCGECRNDVEERYSLGVYAGRLCVPCCAGYRDNCGLDQPQGDPRVLELEGETYWEEEPGVLSLA